MTTYNALNQLFYGDNLDVLRRKIANDSVDLCYIDPPFNSKRNYFQIYNNIGTDGIDKAQSQAFMDTWEWGNEAQAGLDYITHIDQLNNNTLTLQTINLIKGLELVLGHGDLLAYLVHMTLRIVEIHRVLKPTGSFYLHCDPTTSHYLKLILDSIFCANQGLFLNEIIWAYKTGGVSKRWFSKKHDVIFLYTKHKEYIFNQQKEKSYLTHKYGFNNIEIFEDEKGFYSEVSMRSVWNIAALRGNQEETLGYPTQKPEALLERIIKASSNEGDVILDAYCGCGTTVAVAQRLNRQWIGIDITYQSISLILKRLHDQYPEHWLNVEANIKLDGIPKDKASAIALANRKDDKTRKEFEKWAVLTYSNNQARINDKKGADGGVDGIAYFMIDTQTNGKAIFQVKSGGANRATVATLNSDRQREKAEFGILITMDEPSKAMLLEAQSAGSYKHPLIQREDNRIQIITVQDLLNGKRLNLPMGRTLIKSAQAVGDAKKQTHLKI